MTTPKSWTPERIAELRRLADLGFSALKISRLMNTTIGAVSATCFKHGIKTRGKVPNGVRPKGLPPPHPISLPGPEWSRKQKR
jgi:hypothetical protein